MRNETRRGLSLFNILAILLLAVACISVFAIGLAIAAPDQLPESVRNLIPFASADEPDGVVTTVEVPTLVSQASVPTTTATATASTNILTTATKNRVTTA